MQQIPALKKIIALFSLVPPKYNYLVWYFLLEAEPIQRLGQAATPTHKSVFLFLSSGSMVYALFLSYAKGFNTITLIAFLLGFGLGTTAHTE